jgi:type II secretory pathway pseudopilin PulG
MRLAPPRRATSETRSTPSQEGDTLVEVLIAVVIISLVAVALLGTLTTSIASSVEHRSLSVDDTLLKSYAEATKQAIELDPSNAKFSPCASSYTIPIPTTVTAPPSGYSVSGYQAGPPPVLQISSGSLPNGQFGIEYWNGTMFRSATQGGCVNSSPGNGMQLITIVATAPNQVTQSLSFVVRNPNYAP